MTDRGKNKTPEEVAASELAGGHPERLLPEDIQRAENFGSLSSPAKVEYLRGIIEKLQVELTQQARDERDRMVSERHDIAEPGELKKLRDDQVELARLRQARRTLKIVGALTAVAMGVGSGFISAFATAIAGWQLSVYAMGWGLVAVGGMIQLAIAAFG